MGLEAIKGVGPATVKKLNKAGVRTLDDMRKIDIEAIAEKTGIAEDRLGVWKKEAQITKVLDDIKGIGPAVKKKLHKAGIHNIDDLVKAGVSEIAEKTQLAETRVKAWKKEAEVYAKKATAEAKPRVDAATKRGKELAHDVSVKAKEVAHDVTEKAHEVRTEVERRVEVASHVNGGTTTTDPRDAVSPTTSTSSTENKGGFLTKLKILFTGKQ